MSAAPRRGDEVRDRGRRQRLATLLRALGDTEAGRQFKLRAQASFDDFRASIPLMNAQTHAERVTTRLGFELGEIDEIELSGVELEREGICAAWRQRLGSGRPSRVALLLGTADDALIDSIRIDDLRSLTGQPIAILRVDHLPDSASTLLDRLESFAPDALIVPSLVTCTWLETKMRSPLERRLGSLKWIFAHHDLDERIRSRLPVINSGWVHAAGRVGLPCRRSPWQSFALATRSTLIELLPHADPETVDPRAVASEQTILPERAILGQRYELVLSSALGFLRLRSGMHVRVVGFDSLLRPRVVALPPPPKDATLEGVTLPGAWLTATVRQAFLPEDPALIAADIAPDPDAIDAEGRASRVGLDPFADTELGASRAGIRINGPKPRSLVIRVEVHGPAAPLFVRHLASRVDQQLCQRSPAYQWLRERDELWEPRVLVARSGTSERGRERRVRSLSGSVSRPVVQML